MPDTYFAESQAPGALELDPFAFDRDAASRIAGLGGTVPNHDPDYAFHTAYVEAAEGQCQFFVRFHGLAAKKGTLVLRVHMTSLEPGGAARLFTSDRIALNRLVALGGEVSIGFEGFHNVVFALVGQISGDTDASAESLSITLDRPADPTVRREHAAEARSTAYGTSALASAGSLLSTAVPTLADPVSQVATAAQLREPVGGSWMARLRPKGSQLAEHWRKVYTLQALRRYGMLEPGAAGLGFEPSPSGVPAALAAMGVKVVAAFPARPGHPLKPARLKADLRGRAPCDDASFEHNILVAVPNWRRLPDDLVNFDFAWSTRANERLFSVAATIRFIEDVMVCLRPGGIAVHTMSYDLAPDDRSKPSTERMLIQQGDIERIGLMLVSRGHEIAQFKFAAADALLMPRGTDFLAADRTMVGIIVRKARLPD